MAFFVQCAYGGFVFESGTDDNFDNFLSISERDTYEIICNGYDGLTSITVPSYYSGYQCGVEGGVKYETGLDLDEDGTLDLGEIEVTSYICNGVDGLDGLDGIQAYDTLIESFDAGSSCGDAGGYYLEIGQDIDFDGYLDSNEVDTTNVICNGYRL